MVINLYGASSVIVREEHGTDYKIDSKTSLPYPFQDAMPFCILFQMTRDAPWIALPFFFVLIIMQLIRLKRMQLTTHEIF